MSATTSSVDRRAVATWAGLVIATVLSWWLGTGHGSVVPLRVAGPLVLLVAYTKIWFVATEFMEVRAAPRWLRVGFASWLTAVGVTTITLAALA